MVMDYKSARRIWEDTRLTAHFPDKKKGAAKKINFLAAPFYNYSVFQDMKNNILWHCLLYIDTAFHISYIFYISASFCSKLNKQNNSQQDGRKNNGRQNSSL